MLCYSDCSLKETGTKHGRTWVPLSFCSKQQQLRQNTHDVKKTLLKKKKKNPTHKQTKTKNKKQTKNFLIGQYKMCTHFQRKHLFRAPNRHIVH